MRKYLYIFKSELMTSLQYAFNNFSRFIGYSIIIFIYVNLWQYIYSDPDKLINGYTMYQTIWYVIITEIIWMVTGSSLLCKDISTDVKNGSIVYYITKPFNYVNFKLVSHLGKNIIKFILFFIYGLLLGFLLIGKIPDVDPLHIIIIISTIILAIIVSSLFAILIGLFSFVIEDSSPFHWVYSKFILVLGTIFPIEFFPKVLAKILKYTPIFAVSYGPARLFINFTWWDALITLAVQILYLIGIFALTQIVYKKGVKKLNVNGG